MIFSKSVVANAYLMLNKPNDDYWELFTTYTIMPWVIPFKQYNKRHSLFKYIENELFEIIDEAALLRCGSHSSNVSESVGGLQEGLRDLAGIFRELNRGSLQTKRHVLNMPKHERVVAERFYDVLIELSSDLLSRWTEMMTIAASKNSAPLGWKPVLIAHKHSIKQEFDRRWQSLVRKPAQDKKKELGYYTTYRW